MININEELKKAMLSKDQTRVLTIKAIKSAFTVALTEKGAPEFLDDTQEIKILQKLYNQRKESYEIFTKENRLELARKEKAEMEIISNFLPQQLNDEELDSIVKINIEELKATSIKDMGKVIGAVSKQVAGKAEGARISKMVKNLLTI